MDTLFRLVNLHSSDHHHQHQQQQQESNSFNSSRTSTTTSSRSSNHHHQHHPQLHHNYQGYPSDNSYSYSSYSYYYPPQEVHQPHHPYSSSYLRNSSSQEEVEQDQECCNAHNQTLFMDEDFSSSSNPNPNPNPNPANISSSSYSTPNFSLPQNLNLDLDFAPGSRWSTDLLLDCSRAVAARDTARIQQLMWMLNELSSPYGDTEQKIVHYFLQGLFARLTSSGLRTLRTLSSASDRTASFDSTRRTALRFQELSPWSSFGHVAANGAILESFLDGSSPERLHILDISNTFCTQWPTLLEALATRSADDTPHLTITTVVNSPSAASSSVQRVMKEIGARMEKFARLMGVPFKFNIVYHAGDLSDLDLDRLDCGGGTAALAVNFVNALHCVSPAGRRRDSFLSAVRRLRPKIVTVVEEEADLDTSGLDEEEGFMKGFRESLKFFSAYFDSLEESFPKTSNERLALERAAGRAVVDLVACAEEESAERRETAAGWGRRLRAAGMSPARFSDDVADDVRALLRRYREGWSTRPAAEVDPTEGIFLAWKEEPVVWASAWRI